MWECPVEQINEREKEFKVHVKLFIEKYKKVLDMLAE